MENADISLGLLKSATLAISAETWEIKAVDLSGTLLEMGMKKFSLSSMYQRMPHFHAVRMQEYHRAIKRLLMTDEQTIRMLNHNALRLDFLIRLEPDRVHNLLEVIWIDYVKDEFVLNIQWYTNLYRYRNTYIPQHLATVNNKLSSDELVKKVKAEMRSDYRKRIGLVGRKKDLLECVIKGATTQTEIANELGISITTVKIHTREFKKIIEPVSAPALQSYIDKCWFFNQEGLIDT